jgi:acyl carrier protein
MLSSTIFRNQTGSIATVQPIFSHDSTILKQRPHPMNTLTEELKVKIIDILNLSDLSPENFDENDRLVGGSLGIDSIDVLEMVVMVEKDYGVVINSQEVGEKIFSSLASLAEYIKENRPGSPS